MAKVQSKPARDKQAPENVPIKTFPWLMKVATQVLEARQHPPYPRVRVSDREGPAGTAVAAVTWMQRNRAKSVVLEVNLNKGKVVLEVSNIHIKPERATQVFYLKDLFCR